MLRGLLILLSSMLIADGASAQGKRALTAAEMQALVGKGLSVSSMDAAGGRQFTATVNLEPGGRLTGSMNVVGHGTVALNGTWRLQGAQVCRTLGQVQPEVVCETWMRAGNAKEVAVVVGGKEVSINRWQ